MSSCIEMADYTTEERKEADALKARMITALEDAAFREWFIDKTIGIARTGIARSHIERRCGDSFVMAAPLIDWASGAVTEQLWNLGEDLVSDNLFYLKITAEGAEATSIFLVSDVAEALEEWTKARACEADEASTQMPSLEEWELLLLNLGCLKYSSLTLINIAATAIHVRLATVAQSPGLSPEEAAEMRQDFLHGMNDSIWSEWRKHSTKEQKQLIIAMAHVLEADRHRREGVTKD